jgi:hypothetical protein
MFSDYLREVLLLRQGARIDEDAAILFALPVTRGEFNVIDWEEFLLYEICPPDYIFEENQKEGFIAKINASANMMERLRPIFETDVYNKEKISNKMKTLEIVKQMLEKASHDENLFVESW